MAAPWWGSYETQRVVVIQDKTLELLYHMSCLVIVVYIFFSLLLNKGYLSHEPITGSLRYEVLHDANTSFADESFCINQTCLTYDAVEIMSLAVNIQEDVLFLPTRKITFHLPFSHI